MAANISAMNPTNPAGDDARLCQGEEDTMSILFPSLSPQRLLAFPSTPKGFYHHQQSFTNYEMSPAPAQFSYAAAATPLLAAQGTDHAQLGFFNSIEHGDPSGMCEIVAGASSSKSVVPSPPRRQVLARMDCDDPDGGGSMAESGNLASLDYNQQWTSFFFVSQSPPRALSPTLSGSMEYFGGLWNFDDGHTVTLGITTGTADETNHGAAGQVTVQLTSTGGDPESNFLSTRHTLADALVDFLLTITHRSRVGSVVRVVRNAVAAVARIRQAVAARIQHAAARIEQHRSRAGSVAWLHFRKEISSGSPKPKAICQHCNGVLGAASTYGTSHLLRHLRNTHQIDLSTRSGALKRQRSLCFSELEQGKKKQCVENPKQSSNRNKYIESNHVEINPGDVSRKQIGATTRSRSEVWKHFTRVVDVEDYANDTAECRYCHQKLKADSKRNGTSRLLRHITDFHRIKLEEPLKLRNKTSEGRRINA